MLKVNLKKFLKKNLKSKKRKRKFMKLFRNLLNKRNPFKLRRQKFRIFKPLKLKNKSKMILLLKLKFNKKLKSLSLNKRKKRQLSHKRRSLSIINLRFKMNKIRRKLLRHVWKRMPKNLLWKNQNMKSNLTMNRILALRRHLLKLKSNSKLL
jgi:hypothetical protein